jgi:hypothetical protein
MEKRTHAPLVFGVKLLFSCLLLGVVLRNLRFGDIVSRLRLADLHWLLPAMAIGPIAVVLSAWRWKGLSLGLLGFGEAVSYTWIGLFFGSIMPGLIGGDVAKGVSLAAKETRARDARLPVSIIVDKVVGFWSLLLIFSIVALFMLGHQPQLLGESRRILWLSCAATVAGLLAAIAICHPFGTACSATAVKRLPIEPLRNGAQRVLSALGSFSGRPKLLLKAASISIVLHGFNAVALWLVMRSLSIPASLLFAMVFYPLLSVLLALPVSVSGIGIRDVFAAGMFTAFGLKAEAGVAFSWLLLGLSIPNALVGGAIQLRELFRRRATD